MLVTLPTTLPTALPTALPPASLPSPSTGVWYLGPVPIRAYALCILTGVFVAVWWAGRRYERRGGNKEIIQDVAIIAVPAGIVGARIYHVLSSPDAYFGPQGDPALIPQIWNGGLGIWGGIAAGVGAAAWYIRRRGLRFAPLADAVAPALLVAQAIGRLGNWFNQELFGGPTTLPWGLEIDAQHIPAGYAPGTLFHPTFLYEALWNLAGAAFLVWLGRRLLANGGVTGGRLLWAYLMVYTAGRVWIEYLRVDEAQIVAGLRLNVWTSVIVFTAGLIGFIISSRRALSDAVHRDSDHSAAPSRESQGEDAEIAPKPSAESLAQNETR
ncbi:prolipoprotein diacylglyceryl transferase [Actinomyces slackii]|uniref:Phosphatidylglycerol--prolipoprotein diacylglyceryl transferase n=1 Tax=Actinomyces slackii TaxID=52774 RepID=A0A448KDX2_9ACTO|nr:prolipoprotein diacylglyceryl transferase [Actinomyces slackii]VEG75123.1 Prolipoprotein diacylglyceryl transferase [Actinomyces slackii]